jgi:hypothetical protein
MAIEEQEGNITDSPSAKPTKARGTYEGPRDPARLGDP